MRKAELAKKLAKSLLLKEGIGKSESINSLTYIINYYYQMSKEELMGIATLQGIADIY